MEWKLMSIITKRLTILQSVTRKYPLNARSINLSYKIVGDSSTEPNLPPILILHGFLSNKKNWNFLSKTILSMTKRSVVTVDLRNHGYSPHVDTNRYDEMAQDLLHLYKKLDIDKASLIGHCIGGRTCMYVALTKPIKVAGLVVVDSSPYSIPKYFKTYFPKLLEVMQNAQVKATRVPKARKEMKYLLNPHVKDELLLKSIISSLNIIRRNNTYKIGWQCNLSSLAKNFKFITTFPKTSLKGKLYKGPTLFIGGQFSEYIPPDELPKMREMFPKCAIKYLPKAGHYPHVDAPKTFLEHVIPFIRSN